MCISMTEGEMKRRVQIVHVLSACKTFQWTMTNSGPGNTHKKYVIYCLKYFLINNLLASYITRLARLLSELELKNLKAARVQHPKMELKRIIGSYMSVYNRS